MNDKGNPLCPLIREVADGNCYEGGFDVWKDHEVIEIYWSGIYRNYKWKAMVDGRLLRDVNWVQFQEMLGI